MPPAANSRMPAWAIRLDAKVDILKTELTGKLDKLHDSLEYRDGQVLQKLEGVRSETDRAHRRIDDLVKSDSDDKEKAAGRRRDRIYAGLMPTLTALGGAGVVVLVQHVLASH